MVKSIYFLKPAWCGIHPAGLGPDQDLQSVRRATAFRRWFLTFLRTVDEQGRALLRLWHRTGARIVARSEVSRALAEDIVGEPIPTPSTRPGWRQRLRATLRRPAAAAGISALAHQTYKQPVRSIYGLSHRSS
jgi:hypothetical protein